jgi:hypothetical protein
MNCFRHLFDVRPFFKGGLPVGIDAVGASDCIGDCESDEDLLSFRQSSFSEVGAVVGHEFLLEFLVALAHLGELAQIVRMIIGLHVVLLLVSDEASSGARCEARWGSLIEV